MSERLRSHEDPFLYWIGPDISTDEDVVIYSHALVPVVITPESLPSLFGKRPEVLRPFRASARSRYAQLGLDPYEAITQQIAHALMKTDSQSLSGEVTKSFIADVLIYNHGERPIHLGEGSKAFRLYNRFERPLAAGQEVIDLVKSGQVQLKGEQGKDWEWAYFSGREGKQEDIYGINIRINDENRKWIPPDPQNIPIRLDERESNNRRSFDSLSEEVPEQERNILWVGETAPEIILANSVDAIIDKAALPDISGKIIWDKMGVQTESHLIEGGRTNWRVRVEVKSPTIRKRMPNAVTFYLAPKPIAA